MDSWRTEFLKKLQLAQKQCARQFEDALDNAVVPACKELSTFLCDNGFRISTPLNETGRRSFKYELAENAYVLMIFRFSGVGEFELRSETFIPGTEPILEKRVGRVTDIDRAWAKHQFEHSLDRFIDLLAERTAPQPDEEPAVV